jgi:DNA-binding NtrC family response regulator
VKQEVGMAMMKEIRVTRAKRMAAYDDQIDGVKMLEDLTDALSNALAVITAFHPPDIRRGINFYDEVERFEIDLIRQALRLTSGNQRRAARLLALKTTTLNYKIKLYGIELSGRVEFRAIRQAERTESTVLS